MGMHDGENSYYPKPVAQPPDGEALELPRLDGEQPGDRIARLDSIRLDGIDPPDEPEPTI